MRQAAFDAAAGRALDGLLPQGPALTQALRRELVVTLALASAFVVFSALVGLRVLGYQDLATARELRPLWSQSLQLLFQAIAELGGLELTTLLALGLFLYLWRRGDRWPAAAVLALPLASLLETIYKRLGGHAGPAFHHADGPSVSSLFDVGLVSSYPSGHVTRSVIVYGLLAFVVIRVAQRRLWRRAAVVLGVLLIALIAFDRLYLEVHWESDVIGGLLLGGTMLAAAITWMDATAAR